MQKTINRDKYKTGWTSSKWRMRLKTNLWIIFMLLYIFQIESCGNNEAYNQISPDGNGSSQIGIIKAAQNTQDGEADLFASLSAEQVVQIFLKAYQTHDYTTCKALISPLVIAGWTSADQFELEEKRTEQTRGAVTSYSYGILEGSDTGSKIEYVVRLDRPQSKTPGVTPVGGSYTSSLKLQREHNTWKIYNLVLV